MYLLENYYISVVTETRHTGWTSFVSRSVWTTLLFSYSMKNPLSTKTRITSSIFLFVFMPKIQCGTSVNIHTSLKDIFTQITKPSDNYSISLASRLYAEETYPILPVSCSKIWSECISLSKLYHSVMQKHCQKSRFCLRNFIPYRKHDSWLLSFTALTLYSLEKKCA